MNIIVVGCGRVGAELAYRLFRKGNQVTVIDPLAEAFENLPPDFRGRTIQGQALNQEVLRRAGIAQADGLAAVTPSDSTNAVVSHVARTTYHLENVVVRNYDPRRRPLHEAFDLQVVSSASWGAQRIEEILSHSQGRAVFSAGNGEVQVYEFSVPSAWQGRSVQDLLLAGGKPARDCLAVALTRAGRAWLPTPEERLEAGDLLHVSTTPECIEALHKRLKRPEEG
jgi:trk system potassium uptake protein TrkA